MVLLATTLYFGCAAMFYVYAVRSALPFEEGRPMLRLVINEEQKVGSGRRAA